MMPALSASQERVYRHVLASGVQSKRIEVELLNRRGRVIEDLTHAFMGGTATIDTTTDVTRSAAFSILDPEHRYGFDTDTYQAGDLDLSRQVRLRWVTDHPRLDAPVVCGIGYGPIVRLSRNGPVVTVDMQGREVYGQRPGRRTVTAQKGMNRSDALRMFAERCLGEKNPAIPFVRGRLSRSVSITPKDKPWEVMQRLAQSLNRQLFYDGNGVLRLRRHPEDPVVVFRGGSTDTDATLTSDMSVQADLSEVVNRVKVTGKTPKGEDAEPPTFTATANDHHPLSGRQLGPPGVPQFYTEEVTNDQCRNVRECKELANRILKRRLKLTATATWNGVAFPFLEPEDPIMAITTYSRVDRLLDKVQLSLGTDSAEAQYGYTGPYRLTVKRKKTKGGGDG